MWLVFTRILLIAQNRVGAYNGVKRKANARAAYRVFAKRRIRRRCSSTCRSRTAALRSTVVQGAMAARLEGARGLRYIAATATSAPAEKRCKAPETPARRSVSCATGLGSAATRRTCRLATLRFQGKWDSTAKAAAPPTLQMEVRVLQGANGVSDRGLPCARADVL